MEGTEYRQERPTWCPHQDCLFKRRVMDSICGGALPPGQANVKEKDAFGEDHINDVRVCLNETHQPPPNAKVVDFKMNPSDLDWIRFILDALDGKETSWLSRREGQAGKSSSESG